MKKIGILSDTHAFLHPNVFEYFKDCDEIWHAGDIGSIDVLDQLNQFKPTRAVYGNIDGHVIKSRIPLEQIFTIDNIKVYLIHIGGYPKHYPKELKARLSQIKPQLFICGHSHILKVMYDKDLNFLHINPGAAGKYGFHNVITLIKLFIENGSMKDLEIKELPKSTIVK